MAHTAVREAVFLPKGELPRFGGVFRQKWAIGLACFRQPGKYHSLSLDILTPYTVPSHDY